ncbi:hypothetical protein CBS101457_003666 [Exobasidium rhododendri]|nr:hypothetical protein CBS101457_003666 [Exobasidium rhododendri]
MAALPPLLPGWSEHLTAEGQMYWHNASLKQSTYSRPTAVPSGFPGGSAIPMYTGPPPAHLNGDLSSQAGSSSFSDGTSIVTKAKAKKEKPAKKESIPGALGWLRVTTTLGNIFYTHVETKRSEWTIPGEIKEHVEAWLDEEARVKALEEEEDRLAKEQEEEERLRQREQEKLQKLKEEEDERYKRLEELRLREEAVIRQRQERERIQEERLQILREQGKRKRDEEEKGGGGGIEEEEVDKKIRLEEAEKDDDEEAWQRGMAAEMAEEAEREEALTKTASTSVGPFNIPPPGLHADSSKMELSLDEGKALFMHMLTSLNGSPEEVNPMAPWDKELPKIIHHRDYTVLSSLRDRQDAFNEWCKRRLREKRSKGVKSATKVSQQEPPTDREVMAAGSGSSEDAMLEYRRLLECEVKSTRTKWEEFRKAWKKDRRFFAFGRDDREREKVFRKWLKELGEVKRKDAALREAAFVQLLEEQVGREHRLTPTASNEEVNVAWKKVKTTLHLEKDARYEPVGSSTRRAELFGLWARGLWQQCSEKESEAKDFRDARDDNQLENDAQRALRLREESVQKKRRETESDKRRAFGQATRGESQVQFQQLLVDAVRDPLFTIGEAVTLLSSDGRFDAPGLRSVDKEDLIQQHINELNARRLRELHDIFQRHAPTLDVDAEVALPLVKDDDEMERRNLDQLKVLLSGQKSLKDLFLEWREECERQGSIAFQQMLKENAFVNFWGRLRQEHKQRQEANEDTKGASGRQGEDEEDEDDPDMLEMAGNIDLEEIHSILRNDQRYRAFRHQPLQREEWIRNHLQTMSRPKTTVFQRD